MEVESTSKKPRAWWVILFDKVKQYMLFLNKTKRTVSPKILEKRTIVHQGNKLDKRIHVDKSSEYAMKGKLQVKGKSKLRIMQVKEKLATISNSSTIS